MRATLLVLLCAGCIGTPRRPPTVPPARIELEALSRKHFIRGEATAAEQTRLAALLDLHGRGAEAALLEGADHPAAAERAWFAGTREAPLWDAATARARMPAAQARLKDDPRAVRTLWLLGHAAGLDPTWLRGVAARWRADWPESTEASIAERMSHVPVGAPSPVDLDAWAAANPFDVEAARRDFAAAGADTPRWIALRVLAAWDGHAFRIREERQPPRGALRVRWRRAPFVATADDGPVFRLAVRVWGVAVEARDGAVSPIQADGRWNADVDGVPGRGVDDWAPSAGPRWVRAGEPPPALQTARLHWRLWANGDGWRGTLDGRDLPADVDGLIAWLPNLAVHAVQHLPDGGWRVQVAFDGPPAHSLLDDRAVEALGGPISMARLATAERRAPLHLPPAAVDIRVTRLDRPLDAPGRGGTGGGSVGWHHSAGGDGPRTVHRSWRRPAIDWAPGVLEQRRDLARRAHLAIQNPSLRTHPASALLFPSEE